MSVSELVKEISNVIVVQHLDLAMDVADYVCVRDGCAQRLATAAIACALRTRSPTLRVGWPMSARDSRTARFTMR